MNYWIGLYIYIYIPELRHACLAETTREGDDREEVPKPTMVDAAAMVAAIFASCGGLEFRPKA